jgi:hypothetical protein
MGYYIKTNSAKNKVQWLVKKYGAELMTKPVFHEPSTGYVSVVVINNGPFEVAGIAYDKDEFEDFDYRGDCRPKTWLKMKVEDVLKECPKVATMLIRKKISSSGC